MFAGNTSTTSTYSGYHHERIAPMGLSGRVCIQSFLGYLKIEGGLVLPGFVTGGRGGESGGRSLNTSFDTSFTEADCVTSCPQIPRKVNVLRDSGESLRSNGRNYQLCLDFLES